MLLSAEHISLNFGLKQLLEDVTLYLNEGDKIGIIGINGTGKSSLLRVLAGQQVPDQGAVSLDPNVQVCFLPQNPAMVEGATVLEQVFHDFSPDTRALLEYEAKAMLTRLGITDFTQPVDTLSGGQRKRVALAAVLLHPADVLILDEPTNHLDSDMVLWLEDHLRKFTGGLIMVTHDRYFLERVCNRITELSHCRIRHYEANYSKYLEQKTQQEEMDQAAQRKRQSILRVEYQWIMRGAQARRTKNKDRIARYEQLKAQAGPVSDGAVEMATLSSRLGRKTVELDHVTKAFGEHIVLQDFTYHIARDDRVGIVGRNGAGKSTLLNLIAGKLAPDSGTVDWGETVRLGYFSQEGRELDPRQRVYDFIHEIAGEVKTREGNFSATQMMEHFLFPTQLQGQPIGKLSGGERRRLYLLSILMAAPNILLLDEPTNDLDVTTLAILEEYLETFPGAVLAVSHDRYFLDKMAAQIFEVGEGGAVRRYSGNYSDYLAKRREETPAPKEERKKPAAGKPARQRKLKFTFKEQREYDTIEADIAALEARIAQREGEMLACGSDYGKLQDLTKDQQADQAALEEKMERWLYLTDLAERDRRPGGINGRPARSQPAQRGGGMFGKVGPLPAAAGCATLALLVRGLAIPGWLKWDETDLVSPRFFGIHCMIHPNTKKASLEGKPFSMVWFRDRTRCYSRMIPASRQVSMVSSSQVDTWTSPMWALPSRSMDRRDWPMPPPMVRGSSPSRSILWKVSSRRSSQPAAVSWRSRAAGSTRMPMEESSMARPSTLSHRRMSPLRVQSS